MANPLLGQVLGSVFANAMRGRARPGPFGAGSAGAGVGTAALGGILGGLLGRGGKITRGRLSRLAHQLGVREREVALGFAEIVPELVDQLSPGGEVPRKRTTRLTPAVRSWKRS